MIAKKPLVEIASLRIVFHGDRDRTGAEAQTEPRGRHASNDSFAHRRSRVHGASGAGAGHRRHGGLHQDQWIGQAHRLLPEQHRISKNTADMQQKLSAANAEIGELKRAVASLQANVAGLQTNVANLKTNIEQLQQAAKKPDAK
jgi:septal ring factor EnvC (AmiA/AmiB activator)